MTRPWLKLLDGGLALVLFLGPAVFLSVAEHGRFSLDDAVDWRHVAEISLEYRLTISSTAG